MTRIRRFRAALALAVCAAAFTASAGDAIFSEVRYAGDDGGPAPSTAQYRNPVIAGFYPDPSVVRVGDDFYLVNSTFGYFPGLPVFHSTDLVSWRQIGNAIDRPTQLDFGHDQELTRGLFAASISYNLGTYYIVNTCLSCGSNFVITASNPAGPWSDPVPMGFDGIDPSLFFDDDGSAWVVHNEMPPGTPRYDGHRAIWLRKFDPATRTAVGAPVLLADSGVDPSTHPQHIEGPHIFKHDGWYFLTTAEGGTGIHHAQTVWRSRKVDGPYVPYPGNPVLTQRDLDPSRPQPVTSTGHAQFVELKDGSWWAVFLATRPYRGDQYNLGRETFLLPVTWTDGWPVILPKGRPVPLVAPRPALPRSPQPQPTTGPMRWTERFAAKALPMQWLTFHPPAGDWFATGAEGLRVTPQPMPLGAFATAPGQPAYIGHRLQHHKATLETTLARFDPAPGELAGLALVQNEYGHYVLGVERDADGVAVVLYRRSGKTAPARGERVARIALAAGAAAAPHPIQLRLRVDGARLDADYATAPNVWLPVARDLDASILSVETAGGFIGNTFGPYALKQTP